MINIKTNIETIGLLTNMDTKIGKMLLKILKETAQSKRGIDDLFGGTEYLYEEIDMLWDAIAECYEINLSWNPEGDYAIGVMNDFSDGKISITEADMRLKTL